MSISALAFWITYVSGIVAALFHPIAGIVLYLLVYHLNPETQWWGGSVEGLGLRTSFTVAVATGIGVFIRPAPSAPGTRQFPAIYLGLVLFALLAVASLAWGVDVTDLSTYFAEKCMKMLVMLFIVIRCLRTPLHYHLAILAWLVGLAYVGYEAAGGAGLTQGGRLTAGLGGPDFNDSSGLAVHLVASLPLVGAVFFMARTWWGRAFVLVVGALVVNTIIATRTRNVLVGLAVMAVSGVLSLPRGYRLKGLAAVVAGGLLSIQLTDPGWWTRMATTWHYEQDASAVDRLVFWKAAVAMASDYPFGIGLGNFHTFVAGYVPGLDIARSAHNTYAACLAELGWPGLILFLLILGFTVVRLGALQRLARQWPARIELEFSRWRPGFHLGWHALALRTALLGYLACAFFTTRLFSEDLWLMLGFAMCLENVARYVAAEDAHEATAAPEPPATLTLPAYGSL